MRQTAEVGYGGFTNILSPGFGFRVQYSTIFHPLREISVIRLINDSYLCEKRDNF